MQRGFLPPFALCAAATRCWTVAESEQTQCLAKIRPMYRDAAFGAPRTLKNDCISHEQMFVRSTIRSNAGRAKTHGPSQAATRYVK
jgi:hypothetical protein